LPALKYTHGVPGRLSLFSPVFSLALGLQIAAGCGGDQNGHLKYGDAAQSLYAEGLEDFYGENCLDAEPTFRKVRSDYPYSRFSALAELRLADCLFMEGKHPEAIQAYQRFVRHRPSHVEVPYARFRVAEAYCEQMPSDWLLAPPSHERDQLPAQQALEQLRRFIIDYPDDPHLPRAKKLARDALELLAKHELYAAKFYLDRDKVLAAQARLRTLLSSYPESSVEAEAMFMLGDIYLELQDGKRAKKTFRELIQRFPTSEYAEEARSRLGS
jgi:outer membrane protein assembly factor BamD